MSGMFESNRAIYFSMCELYVLIQSCHISEIFIFKEILEQDPSQEEISKAVIGLTNRGFLQGGGNCFRMTEELRTIMDTLKYAEKTAQFRGQMMSIPQQILYFYEDRIVSLEMDEMREGYVRIARLSLDSLVEQILEYDFLYQEYDLENVLYQEYDLEDFPILKSEQMEQMNEDEILFLLEIFDKTDIEQTGRLIIYRLPLQDVIILMVGGKVKFLPCGKEQLMQGIMELSHDIS